MRARLPLFAGLLLGLLLPLVAAPADPSAPGALAPATPALAPAASAPAKSIPAPRTFSVVTYNVENLFDLDGVAAYEDYQPARYTSAHLATKVANIARVLARIDSGRGPDLVLFNEIELDQTPASTVADYDAWLATVADRTIPQLLATIPFPAELAGLPAEAWLLKACADAGLTGYHVVTSDERPGAHSDGRPVAIRNLVFSRFPVTASRSHPTPGARAILEVTVSIDGNPFTIFLNHWKSGAGDPDTETVRRLNAKTLRDRLDELLAADPQADLLVAGDLNSHYNQKQRYRAMRTTAINDILGSQGNELAVRGKDRDLYNLWFELPSDQRGSDIYQKEWGTLMHLILSRGLYDQRGVHYEDNSFTVLKFPGLNADVFGRPVRWSRGSTPHGFSDHFPLYARFRTAPASASDTVRWIPLTRPSETETGPGTPIPVEASPVNLFADALATASLPPETDLRDGTHTGRVFLVEGPATINERGFVKVTVMGKDYDVFTHDKDLRPLIRAKAAGPGPLRFYGELGIYRGNWQFVLQGKEWLK